MSYEIAAKVTVNVNEAIITLSTDSNNVSPKTYDNVWTITAQNVKNSPSFCTTDYQKVMYALFEMLTSGALTLNSTVSAKLRNANTALTVAIINSNWEVNSEEHFTVFMDAFEGKTSLTTGEFVVVTNSYFDYFYKTPKKDTRSSRFAKVFKTQEEAFVIASKQRNGAKVYSTEVYSYAG